jgi:hypothetical protein
MKLKSLQYPLVKLPAQKDLILYLLKEELKSRRFFNGLREIGLDDSYFQPDFSTIVLAYTGFTDEENETYDFYFNLLEKYSQQIEPEDESVMKHAFNVYIDLLAERKRRNEAVGKIISG